MLRIELRVCKDDDFTYILPIINGHEIGRTLHVASSSIDDAEDIASQLDPILRSVYNAGEKDGINKVQSQLRQLFGI